MRAKSANLPSSDCSDLWLARSQLPFYVGEVRCVLSGSQDAADVLLLDTGVSFALPRDIAQSAAQSLVPGDLVWVRYVARLESRNIAATIDVADGSATLVSASLSGPLRGQDGSVLYGSGAARWGKTAVVFAAILLGAIVVIAHAGLTTYLDTGACALSAFFVLPSQSANLAG